MLFVRNFLLIHLNHLKGFLKTSRLNNDPFSYGTSILC